MRDFDIWYDMNGEANVFSIGDDFTEEEKECVWQEFALNMEAQYGEKWYNNLFTKNFKSGMIMVVGTIFMMSTEFDRFWLEFLVDISIASVAWYFFEKILEENK